MESQGQQKSLRPVYSVVAGVFCFAVLSVPYYYLTMARINIQPSKSSHTSVPATAKHESLNQRDYHDNTSSGEYCYESSVPGVYPIASERDLTYDDIAGLSKQELRIMRNEIYARYGYIFKSKDLREYFSDQPWYSPISRDVSNKLTEIEVRNVEFIKKHE